MNNDKRKAYDKAWYEANKDKRKASSKAYNEANNDKRKAYNKAYNEANKDKRKAHNKACSDKLTDGYIALMLRIPLSDLQDYPELIEAKRSQLELIRFINN